MHEVDARGLSCPEPALMTVEAINEFPNEPFRVLVSNATSKQNVVEILTKRGRTPQVSQDGLDFVIDVK
ncbi:MAG: sulfurtransferase TusA family protein [Eggerthellaceae bacterium]|jgi:TusA-related sulfurtransferase|uniref:TusA-related sulfurtransferase n=1 Tax=Denitrobacterium detoxificans TaxID=79604 RepID=A0A172RW10_9ACTN|nr:sulfurtransferase TusA family protein [Denitrobacterium detoxificans]ANE21906.1 disulfide bond formation regulator [Denitrobacterium detoxificans]MBE6466156.1 disulfide bond formation regulator [Denitrobacterium detoxificans]MCR5583365.1 sulfurtransferase TusA family protein [Eggerthellaceae bacterium]SEO45168.1 TusA-related sulfurtransferase [Denitrobacterium detoxificans]